MNIGLLLQFHYVGLEHVDSVDVTEHVSNDNSVSRAQISLIVVMAVQILHPIQMTLMTKLLP